MCRCVWWCEFRFSFWRGFSPVQVHNANQISYHLLVRRGSLRDIRCALLICGGTRIRWNIAVVTSCLGHNTVWQHNGHWFRQRTIETHFKNCDHHHVSSGCFRRSAFEALASVSTSIHEVFLVVSGSHALHGWPCPFQLVLR